MMISTHVVVALLLGLGLGISISIFPPWRRSFWSTRQGLTLVAAAIALGSGLVGLTFLEFRHSGAASSTHSEWHYFGHHLFAVLAAVGAVGVLVEVVLRRALFADFKALMQGLFHFDAEFAKMLSLEARQQLVQSTLVAQLGQQHGDAIYDGVVARYLEESTLLRTSFDYKATLRTMDEDRAVGGSEREFTLKKADYFELIVNLRFTRTFSPEQRSVGCILDEHGEELQKLFGEPQCIFREVLYLTEPDTKSLKQLFEGSRGTTSSPLSRESFGRIFGLTVRLDHRPVDVGSPSLHTDGKCILVPLTFPTAPDGEILHEIEVRTIIAKDHRQYPVHLADPTLDPGIVFDYEDAAEIHSAAAEAFFNSKNPFARNIQREDRRITLRGDLPGERGEQGADHARPWVFPNSGVLFTWRLTPAAAPVVGPQPAALDSEPGDQPAPPTAI